MWPRWIPPPWVSHRKEAKTKENVFKRVQAALTAVLVPLLPPKKVYDYRLIHNYARFDLPFVTKVGDGGPPPWWARWPLAGC